MPGLQYENLPAQRQDPMRILSSRQDEDYGLLESQYYNEVRALEQTSMSGSDQRRYMGALNTKYTSMVNKFNLKREQETLQLKQVQSLVSQGNISEAAGREAMWRMVLPQETEQAMFPAKQAQAKPYSMAQIYGAIDESISEFAEGATDTPGMEWGPPKKIKDDLMGQYLKWRELSGYSEIEPYRQYQLDLRWDAYMRNDDKFDEWWTDKNKRRPIAEVSAVRPTGRIGKAMKSRVFDSASATASTTPLGASIQFQKTREFSVPSAALLEGGVPRGKPKPRQEPEKPSPEQLRRLGTQEAYDKGVELGYWAR